MNSRQLVSLLIAFALALLAVGLPYWRIPYDKLALPNSIINLGLVVPFVAAAVVRFFSGVSLRRSVIVIGLAVPCAVVLRAVVDVFADPTSHNLWPFEVVIASGVGFGVSLGGAVFGSILLAALGRGRASFFSDT
jgi:hypothetical protein